MILPKDPVMLLSVVNTELRDRYPSLKELAKAYGVTEQEISQAHHIVDRAMLLIFVS